MSEPDGESAIPDRAAAAKPLPGIAPLLQKTRLLCCFFLPAWENPEKRATLANYIRDNEMFFCDRVIFARIRCGCDVGTERFFLIRIWGNSFKLQLETKPLI
jgi:hypothetical protein